MRPAASVARRETGAVCAAASTRRMGACGGPWADPWAEPCGDPGADPWADPWTDPCGGPCAQAPPMPKSSASATASVLIGS